MACLWPKFGKQEKTAQVPSYFKVLGPEQGVGSGPEFKSVWPRFGPVLLYLVYSWLTLALDTWLACGPNLANRSGPPSAIIPHSMWARWKCQVWVWSGPQTFCYLGLYLLYRLLYYVSMLFHKDKIITDRCSNQKDKSELVFSFSVSVLFLFNLCSLVLLLFVLAAVCVIFQYFGSTV